MTNLEKTFSETEKLTKVFNTLASGIYLEKQEDVDDFITALKDELQTAIAAGKRVRLK
ncbi:hypothetical protein [Marinobacter nauticus]|uniref:hypothetical protein n=1 Tax=Marinobacter nauticus TaxID=2743 RepID=UPI0015B4798C|nr:hypothetical protein [Marinobacter nauticus]